MPTKYIEESVRMPEIKREVAKQLGVDLDQQKKDEKPVKKSVSKNVGKFSGIFHNFWNFPKNFPKINQWFSFCFILESKGRPSVEAADPEDGAIDSSSWRWLHSDPKDPETADG